MQIGLCLRGGVFTSCNFGNVPSCGADFSGANFNNCQFSGAHSELAASLDGMTLLGEGLPAEQLAACAACGAMVVDDGDEPAE